MMHEQEILERYMDLPRETLHIWIEQGWVKPERGREGYRFREIDVARVGLIHEFSTELELGDDAMEVILPLLDQVHGLRRQLRCLADAVSAQPDDVRRSIVEALEKSET
ncbi:chaperone modulator CbpM [Thalassospiraceae bacterium LMO-JJ14]|nr:chaperone modulator CbpM [Thalassospiraceae bacterium LMO-JJ14]